MTRTITAIATLAAAPLAPGQSWDFELSSPVLSPGSPSATITLFADVDGSEWLADAAFAAHASEEGWSDLRHRIPPGAGPASAQNPGTIMGAGVTGIRLGQLAGLSWAPNPGRIPVWEAMFTVTDFTERTIDLRTETDHFEVYVNLAGLGTREPRIPAEGLARISVIPTPAALALLSLVPLAALRRRRHTKETET